MKFIRTSTFILSVSSLFAILLFTCGQKSAGTESQVDSLSIQHDSVSNSNEAIAAQESQDPNVYKIPADHPWLLTLIGQRFPWDSASECSRITTYEQAFTGAKATTEQVGDNLIAEYNYEGSFIKIAQLNIPEMQDCMENVCQVSLTSDFVPIGPGLHIGMSKSQCLETLGLNKNSKQNIYNYEYKPKGSNVSITVVFEFKNDALTSFSYEVSPCSSYKAKVPQQPFFAKLCNKPFLTMHPDSVKNAIGVHVRMGVIRNNEETFVNKVNGSDRYVLYEFDSSTITFEKKATAWELTHMDLKSPNFGFINGIKVGMTRDAFLKMMNEKDFEGDEYYRANTYCDEGFNGTNSLSIFFAAGLIKEIKYGRSPCR